MRFKNNYHETKYNEFIGRLGSKADVYHKALFYLLAIEDSLAENIRSLYDFKTNEILFEGLNGGFQTSGTLRITRLAFNLFSSSTLSGELISEDEGYKDDAGSYAPDVIFNDSNIFCFVEALFIRFPNLRDAEKYERMLEGCKS